jgi:hypothetical protein
MRFFAFAALGVVLATSGASLAAQCVFDGVGSYSANQTIGPGNPITSLCGHTISGSGGTCTVTMGQNESTGSGTCVTLQAQTTLNMNSHTITCTANGNCDTGVATQTGASGTNKIIGPGTIVGRWVRGASHINADDDTIQDVIVTLTLTSPASSTYGIYGFKTNTRVVVSGATESGVFLPNAGDTLQDSIIHDNTDAGGHGYGVSTGSSPTISGSLLVGNTVNLETGLNTVTLTDSTLRDALFCNFERCNAGSCTCSDASINYTGVNFIDNTILH